MVAVIFEVFPREENKQEYLDIAAKLKPMLVNIDGFISVERFESLQTKGKILSLSFWESEEAIEKWRNETMHREGQANGLGHIFSDYRIRVGSIIRDYGMDIREEAPNDSNAYHK
ncbi:antibiotic biosynthesis monooxygenase [Carboxylicivirga sp. M1479]|uniref:antibiotic biosynthesis monooxygenase family protein n=1 Tax=Carboxylicivirga sp. M1479 TaxID=2594476 RepID=UPI0011777D9F|nr:antibiotic biosynthesis monooxygenase [Carboxylicivirga sp. M1479]TRX72516.1 antibiotic biosynthesis monooxygenase [Carboxylicivirga sp. M1479]